MQNRRRFAIVEYTACIYLHNFCMNLYGYGGMATWFALHFWIGKTCRVYVYILLCRQKDNWSKSTEQSLIVCNVQNVICQSGQSHVDHFVYRFIIFGFYHCFCIFPFCDSITSLVCPFTLAYPFAHLVYCMPVSLRCQFTLVYINRFRLKWFCLKCMPFLYRVFESAVAANCIHSN